MIYTTAMICRHHGRGFRTFPGFLLVAGGILLLALGGFARDKSFKDTAAEKHNFSDYVLGGIGLICLIGGFIYEVMNG